MSMQTKSDETRQLCCELEGFFSDFERQAARKDHVEAARTYRSIIESYLKLSVFSSARKQKVQPEDVLSGRITFTGKRINSYDKYLTGNQLIQLAFSVPSIYLSGLDKKQLQMDYAEVSSQFIHGRHPERATQRFPRYRSCVNRIKKLYDAIHGAPQPVEQVSQATKFSSQPSTSARPVQTPKQATKTTASASTSRGWSSTGKINSLESALDACQRVTSQELDLAQKRLDRISQMIAKAERELDANIRELRQKKYADSSQGASPEASLEKAYTEIRNSLRKQLIESQSLLNDKSRQGGKLSIALFGKTTVGKSTLMSILTHGNSDQIGRGGQRTTRTTSSYEWNGISVTDTPGVEAFGGTKDEEQALYAATQADIIVFLIDNLGTDKKEADWFLKLQALDKPIILLCNERKSIQDELDEYDFWESRTSTNHRSALQEAKEQFIDFLRHERGDISLPPFYFVHLLSKQRADKLQDARDREKWLEASGVREFESQLITYVTANALPARRRAIHAIVDVPIYEHYRKFLQFAASQVNVFHSINTRLEEFTEWKGRFVPKTEEKIKSRMRSIFEKVKQSRELEDLITEYAESSSFQSRFKQLVQRSDIQREFEKLQSEITTEANKHVQQLFEGLKADISLSLQLSSLQADTSELSNTKLWVSGIGSAIGSAIGLIFGPLGSFIGSVIGGLFSWFFDSREDKLRRRREQLRTKCTESLEKMRKENEAKLHTLLRVDIAMKQFKQVETLIQRYKSPFLTLANSHRELAWEYLSMHSEISRVLVTDFLLSEGWSLQQTDRVMRGIARIPNQLLVIDLDGSTNSFPSHLRIKLQTSLGGSEQIQLMSLSSLSKEAALAKLLGYGRSYNVHKAGNITKDQEYVYVSGLDTKSKETNNQIDLAQQLLRVHIIPTETNTRPRVKVKESKPNAQSDQSKERIPTDLLWKIWAASRNK